MLKVLSECLTHGEQVIRHSAAGFKPGTDDEDWLPVVGKNGWILLSSDSKIWKRSVQRDVVFRHGVRGFFFTENRMRGETKAEIVRKALPQMRALVRDTPPPFVASLTQDGNAHIVHTIETHKTALTKEREGRRRNARHGKTSKRKAHKASS
jgi:hypothetical protein